MRSPRTVVRRVLYATPRSPAWPSVRQEHLRKVPYCEMCGGVKDLEVHHVLPVHFRPELELDWDNLVTLCERFMVNCHFEHGHWRDWKNYNAQIKSAIALYGAGGPAE